MTLPWYPCVVGQPLFALSVAKRIRSLLASDSGGIHKLSEVYIILCKTDHFFDRGPILGYTNGISG